MLEDLVGYHVFGSRICGEKIFTNPYTLELYFYLVVEKCYDDNQIKLVCNPSTRALGQLPAGTTSGNDGKNFSCRQLVEEIGRRAQHIKKIEIQDVPYMSLGSSMMNAINFILFTDELIYGRFTRYFHFHNTKSLK